jgi:sulfatase maturation enzyme AslB (radical SAM superfamily)
MRIKTQKLAKLWREIKRPFVRTFQSLTRNVRGTSHDAHANPLQREIAIGKEGKIHVTHIDFDITFGCNLKCEYCCSGAPFRSGIESKETLLDSFEKWSHKLCPTKIRLLGGEPLLHPDLAEIVSAAHRYWSQSLIEIVTNGFLLPRLSDEVLQVFGKSNVHVFISQHMDTEDYRNALNLSIERLDRFHIPPLRISFTH